jgi:hypothetical protein
MPVLRFLAVVFTALALAPGCAHLFALPNKIDMPQDAYFIAQGIYRGWALLGIVLFGALAANLALGLAAWRRAESHVLPLLAFLCIAATLAIFFTWTYPANVATENWTMQPANWEALRTQWEYSHAVNAAITFVALCLVTWSVVRPPR